MTEFELRKWAKTRLRTLVTFEERPDAEDTLRSATTNDFDEFDYAVFDIESECGVVLPFLESARWATQLRKIFTNGVASKLLYPIASELSENVDLGNDKFSKQFENTMRLKNEYDTKYNEALNEYQLYSAGMMTVVQRSGLVYDGGESATDPDLSVDEQ